MHEVQGRKRSKIACKTCRELKRKCDGANPCGTCTRFEYPCSYQISEGPRKRRITRQLPLNGTPDSHSLVPTSSGGHGHRRRSSQGSDAAIGGPASHLRSTEANSGAAFLRKLALRLDPKNAPRLHSFAWNAFLGSRAAACLPLSQPITELLSEQSMRMLSEVYYERINCIYGFIDRNEIDHYITETWSGSSRSATHDAVLCGIAALGYLFSEVQPIVTELHLVETARQILEPLVFELPTIVGITAWILRVIYLRIAGTHHVAWMASVTVMHMIEAIGLHFEPSDESVLSTEPQKMDQEWRRRLVGVAQHHNIWTSFDMGRSRVTLCNANLILPMPRNGDFTIEILGLLPFTEKLDPDKEPDVSELEAALSVVLKRQHTSSGTILGQCNVALCLYRRLQSMNANLASALIDSLLALTSQAIEAAQATLDRRAPWHHMANIPFQVVCVLLAIDSTASLSQLRGAMQCLSNVTRVYNTDATQEALRTASLLILLHKRWKEKSASNLGDILALFPPVAPEQPMIETGIHTGQQHQLTESDWLHNLEENLSSFEHLDLDQLFAGAEFLMYQ